MKAPYQYIFVKYLPKDNSITCFNVSTIESVTTMNNTVVIYLQDDEPVTAYCFNSLVARIVARRIMKRKDRINNFNMWLNYKQLKLASKNFSNDDYETLNS